MGLNEDRILAMLEDIQPDFDFKNSKDFVSRGYLDSFDIITLISELENAFGVSISALDIIPENFSSVEAIENLVNRSPGNAS